MNPMTTLNCGNVQEGGAIPPSISNVVQFPGGKTINKTVSFFETNWMIVILLLGIYLLARKN